jgi:hypothetical protein
MSPEEKAEVLRNAPRQCWVALSHDETRVMAHGATYAEAVARAQEVGEDDPVLVLTPEEWLPVALSAGAVDVVAGLVPA